MTIVRGVPPRVALVAVWVFVFTQPFEGALGSSSLGSVSRALGLLAIAIGIVAVAQRGTLRLRPPSLFLAVGLAFTLFGGVSFFWSIVPRVTLSSTFRYVQLLAMVWLVWQYARGEEERADLMQAFVLGGYVAIGFAIRAFFDAAGYRDVAAGNANDFAMTVALGVPMAVRLWSRPRPRWLFLLNVLYVPLTLFADVLAASRGGLFTLSIALLSIPFAFANAAWWKRFLPVVLLVAGAWLTYAVAPAVSPDLAANLDRLGRASQELESGTLTGRRVIWHAGLQVFRDHPVRGVGLGGYRYAVEPILGQVIASHNSYLSVLIDLGVVGFSLFVLLLTAAFVPALATLRSRRWFNLVMIATLLVGITPIEVEDRKQVWFVLALLAAERPIVLVRDEGAELPLPGGSDDAMSEQPA